MTKQAESRLSGQIITALKSAGIFAFKVHGSALMLAGLPDIIACVDGLFVGFETKMPTKRNNVSPIQERVHSLIKSSGGIAVVVCSVQEVLDIVIEVRAIRRQTLSRE